MKSPDEVFSALARLYDFYRQITKFKLSPESKRKNRATVDSEDSKRSIPAAGRPPLS